MARFGPKALTIVVVFALTFFAGALRQAYAHPATPAAAEAWSLQDQGNQGNVGQGNGSQGGNQGNLDVNTDVNNDVQEGQQGEVQELDGPHQDGAFHDGEVDEDRVEDQLEDQHEDVTATPPPAATT